MKKVLANIFVLFTAIIVLTFSFVACGGNNGADMEKDKQTQTQEPAENADSGGENSQETFFDVIFDTEGGTAIARQRVKEGEKAIKPTKDPVKTSDTEGVSYKFKGWYLGENEFDFNTVITVGITLTAVYETETYTTGLEIRK